MKDVAPASIFAASRAGGIGWLKSAGLVIIVSVFVGLFFMRPNMAEPDSYREALSAIKYIDDGTYASYWDHPLTMYVFVMGTRISRAFGVEQELILNLVAVLFGVLSAWAFFRLAAELIGHTAAFFAAIALISSPNFLEFSTYLSHEIVGFTFALWSVCFFAQLLDHRRGATAFVFGILFAAAWSARPIGALFMAPPLLVLFLFHVKEKKDWTALLKLFLIASAGAAACLAAVYRPALARHLASHSSNFLFTYYEFGRYLKSTLMMVQSALTPVLLGLVILSAFLLTLKRNYRIALFSGSWLLTPIIFYTGMYSMHRYFLALLPPALLMVFAAAEKLDRAELARQLKLKEPAKWCALLVLLVLGLAPNLSDLLYARANDEDKLAATAVGQVVGRNLLFTTAPEPMLLYYNRENPPETVYLVTEYSPGTVALRLDMLRLAQERLREGRPVFATGEIMRHLPHARVDADYELILDFRFRGLNRNFPSLQLFRLTALRFVESASNRSG